MKITYNQIKKMSKDLSALLKKNPHATSHSAILESFSHTLGFADFNALSSKLKRIEMAEKAEKEGKNISHDD